MHNKCMGLYGNLSFIFNTSRELPKEKADFANIECMIMYTNKDFVSTLIFEYNTHWKALESLKICEQTFVCFQSLFLRPPLHNSSASQVELVTDCRDERMVSWTLACWTLALAWKMCAVWLTSVPFHPVWSLTHFIVWWDTQLLFLPCDNNKGKI